MQARQQLETLFYNAHNGLSSQLVLVLAAVHPKDHDTAARDKARLIASYLDRLYVLRLLNDYPVLDRDFDDTVYRLVPVLRGCVTPDDVARVLAGEVAAEDLSFSAIKTYSLRGNNTTQVRYLLTRLTSYVEKGCRKADESERYLTQPKEWHIEHLWPNAHEKYAHEENDPVEFRTLRSRIGALGLLPGGDNSSLGARTLVEKIEFYAPQNILVGVLNPTLHRGPYTRIRDFAKANGIQDVFRPYGEKDTIRKIVNMRLDLYHRLCERIWAPEVLGFAPPTTGEKPSTPQAPPNPAGRLGKRQTGSKKRLAGSVSRGRSDYAQMVRADVITAGTRLVGNHRRKDYWATVGDDGLLYFDNGEGYPGPNEAGIVVKDTASCDGLGFWHVEHADGTRVRLRELRDAARLDGRLPSRTR
jgi:hypothetical protein